MTEDMLPDIEDIDLHPPSDKVKDVINPLFDSAQVDNDEGIINLTQSMRINILRELAPTAGAPKNYKNNRLVVDLLRDTSTTAQSRITSRKDRNGINPELVAALAKEFVNQRPYSNSDTREPPSFDHPLSNREVTKEVITTSEHKEGYYEFENRMKDVSVTDD